MKPIQVLAGVWKQKADSNSDSVLLRQRAGFSVVEVCIGLLIACALAGFALLNIGAILPGMNANKAMYETVAQFRQGRQAAVAKRRDIQLNFSEDDKIELLIVDPQTGGTSELKTVSLGHDFQFKKFDEIAEDTPDQFGNSSAIDFGSATSLTFRPNGLLVDNAGNPVNGTVFIGLDDHPEVARAVTILGSTGRVRSYRWTGTKWIQ